MIKKIQKILSCGIDLVYDLKGDKVHSWTWIFIVYGMIIMMTTILAMKRAQF